MYGSGMASPSEAAVPPAFVRLAAHPVRWALLTELAGSDYRVRELVARIDQPQSLVSYHLRLLRDGGLVTVTRSSFDGRDSYYHLDLDRCADALAETGTALHPSLDRGAAPSLPRAPVPQVPLPQVPVPQVPLPQVPVPQVPVPQVPLPQVPLPQVPVPQVPVPQVTVLFVCTGNSARSPIAEALLRRHTGGRGTVTSAGSRPGPRLHPHAVRVLREEFGIDVSARRPRHLDTLTGRAFDWVITVCDRAREVCPGFGDHARRIHWSIPEPAAAGGCDQDGYPAFRRTAADIHARIRHLLPVLAATGHAATDRAATDRAATDHQEVLP
jgi:ArsR family transcriptional regulator, arsenate/arsenite/antimonite-responsive transcriptional repressor / arsenate reductase (thioredoxin)